MSYRSVPGGWRRARLGDVTRISIGRTPARKRPDYWDPNKVTSNRWVTIADMRDSSLADTAEYISDLGAKESGAPLIPAGTPLMSFKLTVGRVAVAAVPVYTNEAIAAFFTNGEIERSFLTHALPTFPLAGDVDQAVKGQTLNTEKLRNIDVLLPPLPEQRKIAEILSSVDEAIERTEAVIERVQDVKRALAQELLARGMPGRHTRYKQTEVGTIPEEWEVVRLGDATRVDTGFTINPVRRPGVNARPYLRVANVQDGFVDLTEVKYLEATDREFAEKTLVAGDLVMVEGHANISQLGRVAIVPPDAAGMTYQNHIFRLRPDVGRVEAAFLAEFINGPRGRDYFAWFGGTSSGLNTVSSANVRGMPIPLPGRGEQTAIIGALRAADKRLEAERTRGGALAKCKRELASALLTGQIRVVNPSCE